MLLTPIQDLPDDIQQIVQDVCHCIEIETSDFTSKQLGVMLSIVGANYQQFLTSNRLPTDHAFTLKSVGNFKFGSDVHAFCSELTRRMGSNTEMYYSRTILELIADYCLTFTPKQRSEEVKAENLGYWDDKHP